MLAPDTRLIQENHASGTAVITVTVTDGGIDGNLATAGDNASTSQQFTVNVRAINDAPVAQNVSYAPTEDLPRSLPGQPLQREELPCSCHAIAMLFPAIAMLLPCCCRL